MFVQWWGLLLVLCLLRTDDSICLGFWRFEADQLPLALVHQVEQLSLLLQYVDEANYGRSCLYLVSTCAYLPPPDDVAVLQQVCSCWRHVGCGAPGGLGVGGLLACLVIC